MNWDYRYSHQEIQSPEEDEATLGHLTSVQHNTMNKELYQPTRKNIVELMKLLGPQGLTREHRLLHLLAQDHTHI